MAATVVIFPDLANLLEFPTEQPVDDRRFSNAGGPDQYYGSTEPEVLGKLIEPLVHEGADHVNRHPCRRGRYFLQPAGDVLAQIRLVQEMAAKEMETHLGKPIIEE
jgi:hypothetical protein